MITRRMRTVVGKLKSEALSGRLTPSWYRREFGSGTGSARLYRFALVVGFGLFCLGVFTAHRNPATGYEVSIYRSTPALYWIGAGGALLVSLLTLLIDHRSRFAPVSMLLGGSSVASFLALPVVRNYYFHGYADPMTHLGNIRALSGGWTSFFDTVYPGSYVFTAFVSSFTGLSINRSMLYVLLCFAVVFLVFVPLTVDVIVPDRRAVVLGLFSAFLLLPINNVSLYYRFHPFSLTTLFFPVVAYLFLTHVTRAFDDDGVPWTASATTFALPLATSALLFFHPQATVDVLIVFAMVVAVQAYCRRYRPDHPLARYRAIYGQFLLLAVLFLVWASLHQGSSRLLDTLVESTIGWFTGETEAAQVVDTRTDSADTIGVSVAELFVKFFLVSAVYCALAAGVVIAKFAGRLGAPSIAGRRIESDAITYFAVGGIGLVPFVVVHSFGRADAYLFRHLGFGMAIATILGAVALYYVLRYLSDNLGAVAKTLKPVFGVIATAAIVLSLLSVYSSPFLYLPGQHVSAQEMNGVETGFEMQPDDRSVWFGGIRQSSNRYESAMFGAPNVSWNGSARARSSGPVSDENLTRLRRHYQTHPESITRRDHYFIDSRQDYQTETVAYDGVRYSGENVSAVASQPGVYTVYSNGEFCLRYVDTTGTPIVNGTVPDGAGLTNATTGS